MLFGSIKSSSSPAKSASDVFAVACDLQCQLQVIEKRYYKGLELTDEWRRKQNELLEVNRLFQMIEENERKVCAELEQELEKVLENIPYEQAAAIRLDPSTSISDIMDQKYGTAVLADSKDKESVFSLDPSFPSQAGGNDKSTEAKPQKARPAPRVVLPPRWKKVIAMYIAAAVKDRAAVTKPRPTPSTSASRAVSTSPILTAAESLGSHSLTAPSPSIETASLVSSGVLCGGGSRSKIAQAVKGTKKTRRSSGSNWSAKPYKARKQLRSPHASKTGKKIGATIKTNGQPLGATQARTVGLGVLGSQWNANANGNEENINPFSYVMGV